jgi:hypothetical protein
MNRLTNRWAKLCKAVLGAALMALAAAAPANVSPEEAQQLGASLTLFGAIKAGNADGSIPAYSGGLTTPPPEFKSGSGIRPDPFHAEKPLYSIDAKNMDRYADRLSDSTKMLMSRYPGFRIDVYPTHRTAGYPQKVLDNTVKNASRCSTADGGVTLAGEGCHGGLPFPIPKSGYEAMWNHLVYYTGVRTVATAKTYYVTPTTGPVMTVEAHNSSSQTNFYKDDYTLAEPYFVLLSYFDAPPVQAGGAVLFQHYPDPLAHPQRAWQYLIGQRRVKLSPEISYDTPSPYEAGAVLYDESLMFNGSMDRYDFKLVGKKEMYLPYNCYKAVYESKDLEFLTKNFANPDLLRWELHRVWVVEATLKPDKRHVLPRRVFYLDEDSYSAAMADQYDRNGKLFHGSYNLIAPLYDYDGAPNAGTLLVYDFAKGIYASPGLFAETNGLRVMPALPASALSPDVLAGQGVR